MAPEILLENQDYNQVSDFYSLGITVYELAVGTRPYNGERKELLMQQFTKTIKLTPKQLPNWSPEGISFINRLIEINPKLRLGSRGVEQVMKEKWLSSMDFNKVE